MVKLLLDGTISVSGTPFEGTATEVDPVPPTNPEPPTDPVPPTVPDPVPPSDQEPVPVVIPWAMNPNILYVDPVNGSDANNGQSSTSAKATIQAAYDAIPVVQQSSSGFPVNHRQGGLIHLAPGRHDVGVGLNLQRAKEIEIRGAFRASRRPSSFDNKTTDVGSVLFSSDIPEYILGIGVAPDTEQNGYGHNLRDITFEMRGSTKYAILTNDINMIHVEGCMARHYEPEMQPDAWFFGSKNTGKAAGNGSDTSWHRIINNNVSRLGLYEGKVTVPTGVNSNQHIIRDNVCFGASGRAAALIYMESSKGSSIQGNNLEHAPVAIEFGEAPGGFTISTGNFIMGNSGEAVDIWLKATRFYGNIMIDSGSRSPKKGETKLYEFTKNTGHNLIIEAISTAFGDLYDGDPGSSESSSNKRIDPSSTGVAA